MGLLMSDYTPLTRLFAFAVGDIHARRLSALVRAYCWLFRVGKGQQQNLEHIR